MVSVSVILSRVCKVRKKLNAVGRCETGDRLLEGSQLHRSSYAA
jgi:hypothetical protein